MREKLKEKILDVIKDRTTACLATINDSKPWVRYVVCYSDGLKLYIYTYKNSRKVRQIRKNPNVHIAIASDLEKFSSPYVQITGKAFVRTELKFRKKYWQSFLKRYYPKGINDPNFCVIEVSPEIIEYRDTELKKLQILKCK